MIISIDLLVRNYQADSGWFIVYALRHVMVKTTPHTSQVGLEQSAVNNFTYKHNCTSMLLRYYLTCFSLLYVGHV